MAFNSFGLRIVICISLSCVSAISHHTRRNAKELEKINHGGWLKTTLATMPMKDKTYIFMGKILRSFYERRYAKKEDEYDNGPLFPENVKHVKSSVHVVKVVRIFQGNTSVITPLKKILVVDMNPYVSYYKKKKDLGLNSGKGLVLLFAKLVSYSVFKAELILKEKMQAKIKIRKEDRMSARIKLERLRKGNYSSSLLHCFNII